MRAFFLTFIFTVFLAIAGCGEVADAQGSLEVGSIAPAFELQGSDGKTHKLADYVGEHVVLAFFPKAFTSG